MPIDPLGPSRSALNALNDVTRARASSFQRLATGRRVNAAPDDAAALAASQAFEAQVRGLHQANENVQAGISLVQTAEGGLGQVQDLLQRGRELAVQAGNGALAPEDRAAIQAEFNQVVSAVNQIGNNTQFNSIKLLDGTQATTGLTLQTGSGAGETQNVQIADSRAAALGVGNVDLTTQAGAASAMTTLDNALNQVSNQRSTLGALSNGLQATSSNLTTAKLNQTAAKSRLIDADLAAEATRHAALGIRENAAAAVLAQARANAVNVSRLING